MRRNAFQIQGQTVIGVSFATERGYYFFVPPHDRLYRWTGYGWEVIPVEQLGTKRRSALLNVWSYTASA
jgi:hypothetical protein